jgi:hypothetical protein
MEALMNLKQDPRFDFKKDGIEVYIKEEIYESVVLLPRLVLVHLPVGGDHFNQQFLSR